MRLTSKTALFVVGLLAMTTTASSETPSGRDGSRQWTSQQQQRWEANRDLYRKLHNKWHKPKPIPIDPGRGDGKPLDPPPAVPQGPPGFVWVNGHWERVKAPHGGPAQAPTVVVRDHRKPAPQGGVVIRDHRTKGGVVVRDHRTRTPEEGWQRQKPDVSSNSGGVTVSNSPQQRPSVQVRDHRKR